MDQAIQRVLRDFFKIMASVCSVCTIPGKRLVEFPTVRELANHIRGGHKLPQEVLDKEKEDQKQQKEEQAMVKTKVTSDVAKAPPKKEHKKLPPPILSYQYTGQCPDCGSHVETIEVRLPDFDTIVAYCTQCRKQLVSRNVIPIDKQKPQ